MKSTVWLAWLVSAVIAQLQCYNPDGSLHPDQAPCWGSAEVSHCCGGGGSCLTNGLCFMGYDSSLNTGTCTDMNWADSNCFQLCITAHGHINDLSTLYRCDNNEWCCSNGGNTTSCCPEEKRQFKLPKDVAFIQNGSNFATGFTIAPIEASSTINSGSPTVASITTVVTSPSSSPTQSTNDLSPEGSSLAGSENKKAIRVGVGSGLGVGLPLLAMLAGALFFLQRERNTNKELKQRLASVDHMGGIGQNPKSDYPHELSGQQNHELSTAVSPQEFPGSQTEMRF